MIASLQRPTISSEILVCPILPPISQQPIPPTTTLRSHLYIKSKRKNYQRRPLPSTNPTVQQNNLQCSFCGQRNHTKDECWLRGPQFQPKTMGQYTHQFNLKHGNKPPQPSTRRVPDFLKTPPASSTTHKPSYQVNALQDTAHDSYPADGDDQHLNISSMISVPTISPNDDDSSIDSSYNSEEAFVEAAIHSITTHQPPPSADTLSDQDEMISLFGKGKSDYVSPKFRSNNS